MSDAVQPILGTTFHRFELLDRTLPNVLRDVSERFGARTFATLAGRKICYSEIPLIAARTAGAFHSLGVEPGQPIAMFLHNCPEFMATLWAQGWHGGVAVPLNPALRGAGLVHVINDSDARILVCDAELLARVDEVGDLLANLECIVAVGAESNAASARFAVIAWDTLVNSGDPIAAARVKFDDPLMVMYTSGTTGLAKGVVISHHQYYCYATVSADNQHWGPGEHLYTPLQLCHSQAHLSVLAGGLVAGAEVTLPRRFSARKFWSEVAECGATYANVGSAVNVIEKQPPSAGDRAHGLRAMACNPAPSDIRKFEERFGLRIFSQGYGMTEGYFGARIAHQYDRARNCVGLPSPLFSIDIFDEYDVPVQHDGVSIGEIVARPRLPSVMMTRYHKNPTATAKACRNLWFHTGDLAAIDNEGLIYFHGRKNDAIRRRGENISAIEIESAALLHPQIAQAAAYGVPSPMDEQDIKLDIVVAENASLTAEEVIDYLRAKLAHFMVPRYLQFRPSMPMTASERIEKYRLQAEGCTEADYDGEAERAYSAIVQSESARS